MDQNALLFNIVLQKAEHDFQHGERKDAAEEAGWITTTVAHRDKPTTGVEDEVKALASHSSQVSLREKPPRFSPIALDL